MKFFIPTVTFKDVPTFIEVPDTEAPTIEISWLEEAIALILSGVRNALLDDGKISFGEAVGIGCELIALGYRLIAGKGSAK